MPHCPKPCGEKTDQTSSAPLSPTNKTTRIIVLVSYASAFVLIESNPCPERVPLPPLFYDLFSRSLEGHKGPWVASHVFYFCWLPKGICYKGSLVNVSLGVPKMSFRDLDVGISYVWLVVGQLTERERETKCVVFFSCYKTRGQILRFSPSLLITMLFVLSGWLLCLFSVCLLFKYFGSLSLSVSRLPDRTCHKGNIVNLVVGIPKIIFRESDFGTLYVWSLL